MFCDAGIRFTASCTLGKMRVEAACMTYVMVYGLRDGV